MRKLPVFPSMRCDTGCGECCGLVPATHEEFSRIKTFIKIKGVIPKEQGITCPFYQEGTCKVYPVRPLICQVFGHVDDPRATCPRGYNVNIPKPSVDRMFRRNGEAKRFLHEFLPDFSQDKLEALIHKEIAGAALQVGV
jgi:Fe-S-cluster containining protein